MKALLHCVIGCFLCGLFAGGCVTMFQPSPEDATKDPVGEKLARTWVEEGQAFEKKGDLPEALRKYKLALVVSPDNQTAIENTGRLGKEIRQLAEKHYRAGLKAKKRGQYSMARRQFLMALRLRPDHKKAKSMLTTRAHVEAKQYLVHTLQPRESLSMVAKMYYGDYKKFPLIAAYNDLDDATRVSVGQRIKVPQIEGVPFLAPVKPGQEEPVKGKMEPIPQEGEEKGQGREADRGEVPSTDGDRGEMEAPSEHDDVQTAPFEGIDDDEALSDLAMTESEEEPIDVVALYRDQGISLFEQKHYEEAIVELNKAFNANDQDSKAREFLHKSHFHHGLALFNKKNYMLAKKEFEQAGAYASECLQCVEYAQRCQEAYLEHHYNQGLTHFGKEQLEKAIQEWELVMAVDPNYRDVRKSLQKAGLLLKRLEEIKKSESK